MNSALINKDEQRNGRMNTFYSLLITYGKPQVPLMEVWKDFLPELSERTLKTRARHQKLPFPVLPGKTQKSVYLVDLRDLAEYVDATRAEARRQHEAMAGAAS